MSEASSSTATSLAWMKNAKKTNQKSKSKEVEESIKAFIPYEKKITISTPLPVPEYDPESEAAMMKKIVRTKNLLYIPIQVKVKGEWINVDAFIDTGGSNNLARPSLFKSLWKPLKNILVSETVGGHVQLTHYVDNIPLKVGGSVINLSTVQHFDPSASLFLGMKFINSILIVTLTEDKLICTIKKKFVAMPRLFLANLEARKEQS